MKNIKLVFSSIVLLFMSYCAYGADNNVTLSQAQVDEYCSGVSLARISVLATLLKHPQGSLSLNSVIDLSLAAINKQKEVLSEAEIFGATSQIKAYTVDHINQIEQHISMTISRSGMTKDEFLALLSKEGSEMVKPVFTQCRKEIMSKYSVK